MAKSCRKNIISLFFLILCIGLFVFMAKFNRNFSYAIPLIGDEPSYMAMADSFANFKTFNLKKEVETKHYRNFFIQENGVDNGVHAVNLGNKQFPKHGIAWSVLLAPLFLIKDNPRLLGMLLQNFIVVFLAANIFLWLREQKYNSWLSAFVSLSIIFTLPIIIQTHMLFCEPLGALCLIYALRKWDKPNVLSALAIAVLPWIHIKYIIFIPFLIWPWLKINLRKARSIKIQYYLPLIMVILSIIGIAIFNIYAYNTPFSAQEKSSSFLHNYQGLMGIFVNQIDGLLPFAPIYILAFIGIGALYKDDRKIFWQIIFTSVILWLITGVFQNWGGGQAPPARMILVSLPVLAPALAKVLELPLRWLFRTIYLILLVPSLFLGFRAILQPIKSIARPSFSHLNEISSAFGLQLNIEKIFPLEHYIGYNLSSLWLLIFVILVIAGYLIAKYHCQLEDIDEAIDHYPRL